MKKTILFILNKEVTYLPPFMAILDSLCDDYSLKVISYEKNGVKKSLEDLYIGKDIEFLSTIKQDTSRSLTSRVKRKLYRLLRISTPWHREAASLLKNVHYDLLWVAHENAAVEFKKELVGEKYVLNIFELYDIVPTFLKKLKPLAQDACSVIVPEYNRACMLKFWLQLKDIPQVIPNKPFYHPSKRNIPNEWAGQLAGKKVLLYQGYINRNRNIEEICKAVESLPGWRMVALGSGEHEYIEYLKHNYPNLFYIGFVSPPHHLDITSWAYVGVVKYDWFDLNHVYCAPNKTWEYAGFGIPMIGNELPGLRYTIGQYGAGICTDLDSIDCIRTAIMQIDQNYEEYSKNAIKFYNSFNIKKALDDIVKRQI